MAPRDTGVRADDVQPPEFRYGLVQPGGQRRVIPHVSGERNDPATQIGPTRIRGAELTRFISTTPTTPWLAIHILRSAGKTLIFFVPRQSLDERPATR